MFSTPLLQNNAFIMITELFLLPGVITKIFVSIFYIFLKIIDY